MGDRLASILSQLAEQGKLDNVLDALEKSAKQETLGESSSNAPAQRSAPRKLPLITTLI